MSNFFERFLCLLTGFLKLHNTNTASKCLDIIIYLQGNVAVAILLSWHNQFLHHAVFVRSSDNSWSLISLAGS